jgi:hypothetical protein
MIFEELRFSALKRVLPGKSGCKARLIAPYIFTRRTMSFHLTAARR